MLKGKGLQVLNDLGKLGEDEVEGSLLEDEIGIVGDCRCQPRWVSVTLRQTRKHTIAARGLRRYRQYTKAPPPSSQNHHQGNTYTEMNRPRRSRRLLNRTTPISTTSPSPPPRTPTYLAISVHMRHHIMLSPRQFWSSPTYPPTTWKLTRNFFSYSLATLNASSDTTTCSRIWEMASSEMSSPSSFSASASQTHNWRQVEARVRAEKMDIISAEA